MFLQYVLSFFSKSSLDRSSMDFDSILSTCFRDLASVVTEHIIHGAFSRIKFLKIFCFFPFHRNEY